ncbi:MAG: hypothetical protein AB7L84_15040 [Acidimicrobiia bacterium]
MSPGGDATTGPVAPGSDPVLSAVLSRLARPFHGPAVVEAVCGLDERRAQRLVGVAVAASPEADRLLDSMPHTVRSLAVATADTPVRCQGEVRGPILWAETVSARAATAGDPGLFVCASPSKAFDTEENRVLAAALGTVRAAAEAGAPPLAASVGEARRARINGSRAARYLEHRGLADLSTRRPGGRAVARTRTGKRRATYRPAVELLARADDPLTPELLLPFVGTGLRARLALLVDVLDRVEAGTGEVLRLRAVRGALVAGPVRFRAVAGTDGRGGPLEEPGVHVAGLHLDATVALGDPVPSGRQVVRVASRNDLEQALEVALGTGDEREG